MNTALVERYFLITIQMTVGLAGLLPILICLRADGSPRRNQRVRVAIATAILLSGIFYALDGWQGGIHKSYRFYRLLERRKMAISLWREAPFISPLPISEVVPPPDCRVRYLSLVEAGLCPDYSDGWWLAKHLKMHAPARQSGRCR